METLNAAEKHPYRFSLILLLLLVFIQSVGVAAATTMELPANSFGVYTEIVLTIILVLLVTRMKWWREIGYRKAAPPAMLLLYLPALVLPIGNLTFGIAVSALPALLNFALLAATSGFVEETVFRGLMLRAFLPRGKWQAVLISTAFFGFTHIINVFAGYEPLYAVIQVCYALAIGFGFGAMVVKGRLLWPLVIAHALGNFFAFINSGEIGLQLYLVSIIYILLFSGYGLYLMLQKDEKPAAQLN
jgi:hypothetical protein